MKFDGGILKFNFMHEDAHGKIKGYQKRYQKEGDQNAQGKETGKARKETGEIGNAKKCGQPLTWENLTIFLPFFTAVFSIKSDQGN